MKAELRVRDHSIIPGAQIIEVWYDGRFYGTVAGADDKPGIRVISKDFLKASPQSSECLLSINVIEVEIKP